MKKQIKLVVAAFAIMLVSVTSVFAANYRLGISDFNSKNVMFGTYKYEGDSDTRIEFYLNKSDKVGWERRYKSSTREEDVMSAWDDIDFWINYSCGLDNATYYIVQSPGVIKRKNDGAILKFYLSTGSSDRGFIYAAKNGNLKLVKAYVEIAGIDVDVVNGGTTALREASRNNRTEVVNYLKSKGAKKMSAFSVDLNKFTDAVWDGNLDLVKQYVEELGVDVNGYDDKGGTALCYAARAGRGKITQYLLSKGADPNLPNKKGELPLHRASYYGRVYVVQYLLMGGADPNKKDYEGKTALDKAYQGGITSVRSFLKDAGGKYSYYAD